MDGQPRTVREEMVEQFLSDMAALGKTATLQPEPEVTKSETAAEPVVDFQSNVQENPELYNQFIAAATEHYDWSAEEVEQFTPNLQGATIQKANDFLKNPKKYPKVETISTVTVEDVAPELTAEQVIDLNEEMFITTMQAKGGDIRYPGVSFKKEGFAWGDKVEVKIPGQDPFSINLKPKSKKQKAKALENYKRLVTYGAGETKVVAEDFQLNKSGRIGSKQFDYLSDTYEEIGFEITREADTKEITTPGPDGPRVRYYTDDIYTVKKDGEVVFEGTDIQDFMVGVVSEEDSTILEGKRERLLVKAQAEINANVEEYLADNEDKVLTEWQYTTAAKAYASQAKVNGMSEDGQVALQKWLNEADTQTITTPGP